MNPDVPILNQPLPVPNSIRVCLECYHSNCFEGMSHYKYGPDPLDIETDGECACRKCHVRVERWYV